MFSFFRKNKDKKDNPDKNPNKNTKDKNSNNNNNNNNHDDVPKPNAFKDVFLQLQEYVRNKLKNFPESQSLQEIDLFLQRIVDFYPHVFEAEIPSTTLSILKTIFSQIQKKDEINFQIFPEEIFRTICQASQVRFAAFEKEFEKFSQSEFNEFIPYQGFNIFMRNPHTNKLFPIHQLDISEEAVIQVEDEKLKALENSEFVYCNGTQSLLGFDLGFKTFSTYPEDLGNPIADHTAFASFLNRSFFVMCDGCGWGSYPSQAARYFSRAIVHFLVYFAQFAETTVDIARLLLGAIDFTQRNFLKVGGKEKWISLGTTTVCISAVVQVQSGAYVVVSLRLGDGQVLIWNRATQKGKFLFPRKSLHARDPEGRLGPVFEYETQPEPDLRNLSIVSHPASGGDILSLMTDGIYENYLHPEELFLENSTFLSTHPLFDSTDLGDYVTDVETHLLNHTKEVREIISQGKKPPKPENPLSDPKLDHASILAVRLQDPFQKQKLLLILLWRKYLPDSPWHKSVLPLDILKSILTLAGLWFP